MAFTYVVLRSEPQGAFIASTHMNKRDATRHARKLAAQAITVWGPEAADHVYYVAKVEYLEGFSVREESAV